MKNDSRRLEIVKKVFASRELDEARRLKDFQKELDELVAVLRQLRDYRDRNSATLRNAQSTDPGRMQNQQTFHSRLNEAISQQEILIKRAETERNELRKLWLARRRKTQSIGKLSEQWQAIEQKDESTREQKMQDDLVQASLARFSDTSSPS